MLNAGRKMRSIPLSAAGVKQALAPRSKVIALDRVEVEWSSLEKYFTFNASVERVLRDSRGRFESGTNHHGGWWRG